MWSGQDQTAREDLIGVHFGITQQIEWWRWSKRRRTRRGMMVWLCYDCFIRKGSIAGGVEMQSAVALIS